MSYTAEEIQAVRYYIGDVKNFPEDGFWNDPKAYCLLNALFFPALFSENARIKEGKILNPEILADVPRLTEFFKHLFSAFRKSEQEYFTYRVERYSDFMMMKQNHRTISFTSTSKAGFLKAYQDRKGIALLKFQIPEHTLCIDMEKFFQNYAKPEEAEILLPPFLNLQFEDLELSDSEKQILDADGKPPLISCLVRVGMLQKPVFNEKIPPQNGNLAGIRVLEALKSNHSSSEQDISDYSLWKEFFTKTQIEYFFRKNY